MSISSLLELVTVGTTSAVFGAAAWYFFKPRITRFFNEKSGYQDALENGPQLKRYHKALQTVDEVFKEDENLEYLRVELSDCAILKKRGETRIELDFRRLSDQMFDAIIYTMVKDMTGIVSEEEIYQFVKDAKQNKPIKLIDPKKLNYFMHNSAYKKVIEQRQSDHQGELIDSVRIILHSHMRCSWARNAMDNLNALEMAGNIIDVVGSLLGSDNTNSNVSRNGAIGLRSDGNILVKPQTDGERLAIKDLNDGVLGLAVDAYGNTLDGRQGFKNYAKVRLQLIVNDIDDLIAGLNGSYYRIPEIDLRVIPSKIIDQLLQKYYDPAVERRRLDRRDFLLV